MTMMKSKALAQRFVCFTARTGTLNVTENDISANPFADKLWRKILLAARTAFQSPTGQPAIAAEVNP